MYADWKLAHINEAVEAAQHEMVENVLSEFALNMGFERRGLPEYGLQKIVQYVAVVAYSRALGIDPDTLRLSYKEDENE